MQQQFELNRQGGLEDVDFRKLGFKCGLEIHHQIFTEKKLFCRCPAGKYSNDYHAEVLRHMRPTLSELGEYDGTALMEFKTKKEIIYRLNKDSVCTYEMDDTPPFPINLKAVDIAIEIALLLNCKIVDEVHIARKQYLDGSIPTGFQRTTIVGWDGWIPYKGRKIGIIQLALEEDACREVSDVGHRITFIADRLCMPLIEVVTAADMQDPVEAAEVGGILGTLLRLTGKVRRGYGSARQDVNVSITGGDRVEIKGVPRLGYIPRLTGFEALRQKSLIELRDLMNSKGFKSDEDFKYEVKDLTDQKNKFEDSVLVDNLSDESTLQAVCFKNLKGLFSYQLNPDWNFSDEVSGRVRVIACLDILPNLLHTDTGDKMSIYTEDIHTLKNIFKSDDDDVVAISWGPAKDVGTAISEIIIRVKEITQGVINETRQRRRCGLTDFERILPGPDRMYPDTDSPPTVITEDKIAEIAAKLPEQPWTKVDRFMNLGNNFEVSWSLLHSPYLEVYESVSADYPEKAKMFTKFILQYIPHFSRKKRINLSNEKVLEFLQILAENNLHREEGIALLKDLISGSDLKKSLKIINSKSTVSDQQIDDTLRKIISENDGFKDNSDFIIGRAREKLDGRISGEMISQRLKKISLTNTKK